MLVKTLDLIIDKDRMRLLYRWDVSHSMFVHEKGTRSTWCYQYNKAVHYWWTARKVWRREYGGDGQWTIMAK